MELYLMQHGEAALKEANPERPLTERGKADVARVAHAVRAAGVTISDICHSGKLRAKETAEIVAKELRVQRPPSAFDGLSPNDDPTIVSDALDTFQGTVMLVGHLPHMSRFCSLLLTGEPDTHPVKFSMGGIVSLVKDEGGSWRLRWMLTPEVVAHS